MSGPTEILHRVSTSRCDIRFVSSPLFMDFRQSDFPWCVLDDIVAALAIKEAFRIDFLRRLAAEWADETRMAATDEGILRIAPHALGSGLIEAVREANGIASEEDVLNASRSYYRGIKEATASMLGTQDKRTLLLFMLGAG